MITKHLEAVLKAAFDEMRASLAAARDAGPPWSLGGFAWAMLLLPLAVAGAIRGMDVYARVDM